MSSSSETLLTVAIVDDHPAILAALTVQEIIAAQPWELRQRR